MYATVDELRNVAPESTTDAQIELAIQMATELIDRITGQWFEPRRVVRVYRSKGGTTLHLPVPVIEVRSVTISGVLEPAANYRVTHDARNPRILHRYGWPKGRATIEVDADCGYVAEDGTTPAPIRYACQRLASMYLLPEEDRQELRQQARVISESTDGHSYTLAKDERPASLTGDPEIDGILMSYMRLPSVGGA